MARTAGAVLIAAGIALAVTCAAAQFPTLSGRVVDGAALLDDAAKQRIAALLAGHEAATGNQVVVVTLDNLDGSPIEEYGYQLGRAWAIGEKGKDNGVLLIVARDERKVRIEVGYGLEGVLTDAISANIVHAVILPEFKAARFAPGIENGARAIVAALGGEYRMRERDSERLNPLVPLLFMMFIPAVLWRNRSRRSRGTGMYGTVGGLGGTGRGGGFGSRGGGFSGGGGGFGGGGASGGW